MKFKMAAAAILNLLFLSIFGQVVYFRGQPSTFLQNFVHLRVGIFLCSSKSSFSCSSGNTALFLDHALVTWEWQLQRSAVLGVT